MSEERTAILAIEKQRYAAMIAGNARDLEGFLDEALAYTHSDGSRDTRESYLAKVAAGHFHYHRIDAPVDHVETFDETAIVIGRMLADVEVGGEKRSLANASLAVYRRRDGAWRLVAYQPTPLPRA